MKIEEDIHWVGINDRTTDLFESVWPLPKGVSYNAYLIDDEKTALIDTVKKKFEDEFIEKVKDHTDLGEIDYIIINHMEPDHSGALSGIRRLAPETEIIGTKKTEELLGKFYGIKKGVRVIDEGDTIDLGERTLKFLVTPFVHWPETMMTYETTQKVLFTGDAFGGFGTLDGGIFDGQMELDPYFDEVLRYFSNIIGVYTRPVQAALKKLENVDINVIAPSHALIWREQPETIIELYDQWSKMEGEEGVTLVYGSMYGNTRTLMEEVAKGIISAGCTNLRILDASRVHLSYLLAEAWRRKGVIIGSPTYDGQVFPPVAHFIDTLERKKLKKRVGGIFGSYGWSGGAIHAIQSTIENLDWELVEPIVEFRGAPTKEELKQGRRLGKQVAEKLSNE